MLDWNPEDVRLLDELDDVAGYREIVALYSHEGEEEYYFRLDLFSLAENVEENSLDVYLALQGGTGANRALVQGTAGFSSDMQWDVLVVIDDLYRCRVLDGDYEETPYFADILIHPELDFLEFSIDKKALADTGWADNEPLTIQAFTTGEDEHAASDKTSPVSSVEVSGTASVILSFSPAPSRGTSGRGWVVNPQWLEVLDAFEHFNLPLSWETYSLPLSSECIWFSDQNALYDRIRALYEAGLLELRSTPLSMHFPAFFSDEMNTEAILLGDEFFEKIGVSTTNVVTPMDGAIDGRTLKLLRQHGYEGIVLEWDMAEQWFTESLDPYKIQEVNGVKVFIDNNRWESFLEDIIYGAPGEWASEEMRFMLLDNALAGERQQILYMNLGYHIVDQDDNRVYLPVIKRNVEWIANHPWIKPLHFDDILGENQATVNHGQNVELPLVYDPSCSYYGETFRDEGETINYESYFEYIPFLTAPADRIPSMKKAGDYKMPGTIIHDTWEAIKTAPEGYLKELAKHIFLQSSKILSLHYNPNFPGDDYGEIGDIWMLGKMETNRIRGITVITAAADWADEVKTGKIPGGTVARAVDLDQDGEDEYILKNNKIFAVFENDGGRLQYLFAYDEMSGGIDIIGGNAGIEVPDPGIAGNTVSGEGENGPRAVSDAFMDRPVGDFDEYDIAAYEYFNDIYSVTVGDDYLKFVSGDGRINKEIRLEDNVLIADYRTDFDIVVEMGLSPDFVDMFHYGQDNLDEIDSDGWYGVENRNGGYACISFAGAVPTEKNEMSPYAWYYNVTGDGEFSVSLKSGYYR